MGSTQTGLLNSDLSTQHSPLSHASTQHSALSIQPMPQARNMHHTAVGKQNTTPNMQHSTLSTEHSALRDQHATLSTPMQQTTERIQHTAYIDHST